MKFTLALAALGVSACASPMRAPKVLVVGVDGLRPDQLQQATTPVIDGLIEQGAVSYTATNAWTADDPWNGHSATNWGVLLTGLSPRTTDLTANGDEQHLVNDDGEDGFRSLFGHLKHHDPAIETAVFNTWPGIGMQPGTILGSCRSSVDQHFSSVAETSSAERDMETTRATVSALGSDCDVLFVHLSQADSAGHAHTYDDPRYRASIEELDRLIGEMLRAIEQRGEREHERWLILLSTDHGGMSDSGGHADNTQLLVHTIPLLVSGDAVPHGATIGATSLYDVTPTVLAWMGVDPGPLGLDGRVVAIGE